MLEEKGSCPTDIVYQSLTHSYGDVVGYVSQSGDVGSGKDAILHQPAVLQQPPAPGAVVGDAAAVVETEGSWCAADDGDTVQAAQLGDGDA